MAKIQPCHRLSTAQIRFFSFQLLTYFNHLSLHLDPFLFSTLVSVTCQALKSMHIRKKNKLHSSPARGLRQLSLHSDDSSKLSLVITKRARRRRMKQLRPVLNYTCRTDTHFFGDRDDQKESKKKLEVIGDPLKITINLSSSSENNNTNKDNDGIFSRTFGSETVEGNGSEGLERGNNYGVVSVIGRRNEMEDAVRAELGFAVKGSKSYDFFGVYDGHGGSHVARACRERLHEVVAVEIEGNRNNDNDKELEYWEKLMERCFGKMDEEVMGNAAARTVGATVVVAVVAEEEVVVANYGDCRAVMSRAGLPLALSTDHKPERADELERIEAAGGRVIILDGHRVLGVLATSRSIGDQYLRPFVISKPEVTVTKRTEKDEFLVLACDGLWDVVSNEVACKVVKKCLEGRIRRKSFSKQIPINHENRASEAAAVLAELATARGSRDNISVIVVDLRNA